jgi:hypothetical protein
MPVIVSTYYVNKATSCQRNSNAGRISEEVLEGLESELKFSLQNLKRRTME